MLTWLPAARAQRQSLCRGVDCRCAAVLYRHLAKSLTTRWRRKDPSIIATAGPAHWRTASAGSSLMN